MLFVMVSKYVSPVVVFVLFLSLAPSSTRSAEITFDASELTVVTLTARHTFRVELAQTADQRRQGLMFRKAMDADAGMLFDYGRSHPVTMWMKNTLITLDMLFIGADGTIEHIVENASPGSLKTISSNGPVLGVLELNGGTATRLDIRPGDRIEHAIFSTGR